MSAPCTYPPRELSLEPVEAILAQRRLGGGRNREGRWCRPYDDEWLGRRLGSTSPKAARQRAHRVRRNGLTVWEADRLAVALGWLPWTIWGEQWWMARGTATEDRADGAFRVLQIAVA